MKIRDLALGGDKAALPFNEEINKILEIPNANEAAKEMQKFESRILEIAVSPLEFLTLIEKQHLERLKQDRNLCAHPALTRDGELFIPPPEMNRLYIVQSCNYLLCQAPTQGKVVIEKILKLIRQTEFPVEIDGVQNALADPIYLGKAKESTLKSFLIEMLKLLLVEDTANNEEFQKKVALSVSAIRFINRDIYNEIFQIKFPNLINEVDIQKLKFIFLLLSEDVELWDKLHPSTQTKLIQLVKNMSYDELRKYEIIECGKSIISIKQGLFEGLDALEPMEKIDSIYYNPDAYLKDYAINTFVNSWSFDLAETSFRKCVFPYIRILNSTDLEDILKGALNNKSPYEINQILKARGIPHLFRKFYETLKARNLPNYKEMTGVRNLGPVECRDFPLELKAGESRNEEESIYRRADRQSVTGSGNGWKEGCRPAA